MSHVPTTQEHLDALSELEAALTAQENGESTGSTQEGNLAPFEQLPQRLETVVEEESSHGSDRKGSRKVNKNLDSGDNKTVDTKKKKRHRQGKVRPPNTEKVKSRTKLTKGFHKGKGSGWRVAGVIVKYVRVGRQGYLEKTPFQGKLAGRDTTDMSNREVRGMSSFRRDITASSGPTIQTMPYSMMSGGTEQQNGGPMINMKELQYASPPSQVSPDSHDVSSLSPSGTNFTSMSGRKSAESTKSTSSLLSTSSEYGRPQMTSSPRTYSKGPIRTEEYISKGKNVVNKSNPQIGRIQDSFSPGGIDYNSSGIEEDMASSRHSICSVSSGMLDEGNHVMSQNNGNQGVDERGGSTEKLDGISSAQLKQENNELRKQLNFESQQNNKLKGALEAVQEEYEKLQDYHHHNSGWEGQYQQVQTELKVSRLNNDEKDQMIESLQAEVKSLRNEVNLIEKARTDLVMDKEELESKVQSMENQLDQAQSEVKWEESNAMTLESQVESLQMEICQLRDEYTKVLDDKETLEDEVLSLTSQLDDADIPINRSKTPDSRARTPDSQASAASVSNSDEKVTALKSEVKMWKEKHNQLSSEKRLLQKKFESTSKELEHTKKGIKHLELSTKTIASKDADEARRLAIAKESLEQELNVVKSLADVRQKQTESLQKELDNMRKLAEERQKEMRSLQQNLRSSQKLAKGREHEIDSLQQELVGTSGLAEDRNRQLEYIQQELEMSKLMSDSKHGEVHALQQQLRDTNEQVSSRNKDVDRLKRELESATQWAEDKQLELETLQQDLVGTHRVAEGRQQQINSLQSIVAIDLCEASEQGELTSAKEQKTAILLNESRSNREEIERLTRDLTIKMKEAAADREVNEYLCNEKYKLQSEKAKLEGELATVKDEFEKYRLQHSSEDKVQKAEMNELKARLNMTERMKDTLGSEMSQIKLNMTSDLSESSEKLSSLTFDMVAAKAENESLKRELEVINAALTSERKQCETLREEWQKELVSKRRLEDKVHDLDVELDATKASFDAGKDYAVKLQEEKEQAYTDFKDTIKQLSERDRYITRIQDNNGVTSESLARQYSREKYQIEQERDTARKELKHLREECDLITRRMDQKDAQLLSFRQTIQELESEHRFGSREKDVQVRLLEEELNGTKLLLNKLKTEKRSKEDMITDLQDALGKATRSNSTLKKQLKQHRDAASQLVRSKEMEHEDLTHNISKAEELLRTAEQNYQVAMESKSQLGIDIKLMENMISTLKAQLMEERSNRKLAEKKVSSLKAMLEEERKKRAILKEEISSLQLKLSKAEATVSFQKSRMKKMQDELNTAETNVNSKDHLSQTLQDQLNQYQIEVSSLKRQLETQEDHWTEKNRLLSSELAHKSEMLQSDKRQLETQVQQMSTELDKKRDDIGTKTREVLRLKRELGDISVDREVLQTQLSQTHNRLKTNEKFARQRSKSYDDLDSFPPRSMSRRSSDDFDFELPKIDLSRTYEDDFEPAKINLQTKQSPSSHTRTHYYHHHQPVSGMTRFEVEQMMLDLNRQIQKQLDEQRETVKTQKDDGDQKRLTKLENELSLEKAFRSVEKLQIQALHDEMNNLRQLLQNLRRSRDNLASERNQQRVMNRMDEINTLIAHSHARAQTMAFSGVGMATPDNPMFAMTSKDFIAHLYSQSPPFNSPSTK
ncbi:uncharacterized protein LOC144443396 isoform X2 [Glandiceps talaboti]